MHSPAVFPVQLGIIVVPDRLPVLVVMEDIIQLVVLLHVLVVQLGNILLMVQVVARIVPRATMLAVQAFKRVLNVQEAHIPLVAHLLAHLVVQDIILVELQHPVPLVRQVIMRQVLGPRLARVAAPVLTLVVREILLVPAVPQEPIRIHMHRLLVPLVMLVSIPQLVRHPA